VAGNTTNINAVAADASDIGTVASNISNVNTTAGISSDVTTVAGNNANITTVAGDSSEITTVAGVASDVSIVSGIASDVTAVAGDASDIGTVASSISNVNAVGTNITNVNNVAGNASNINTVAADGTDIGTVAGISANVTTVAGISSDVTTVAGLETKMDTVIADASDIGTVAGISANVTTVANNSSNVTTVAGLETKMDTIIADASDIGAVATNINSVTTVSGISGDVTTVASKASDVETVADNIGDVQAASQNATNAAASAQAAASSASTAGTHATNASASANQAANSATGADDSEAAAGISASAASSSASAASSSASSAASSASDANDSQAAAALSASGASVSASAASGSASAAASSETNAAASATTATNIIADLVDLDSAVTNAAGSATSAATSASTALGYRNEAETHKNNAYTYSQSAASAVAYQDLAAIAESKSVTAADVFVYDTSKDSDGGAWRNRTQGTSWYNEALNTSTRGATKKFPAVAVIVLEDAKLTIYDADDPSMPMWMVFTTSGIFGGQNYKAVSMLNGMLFAGSHGWGAPHCNFISDRGEHQRNVGATTENAGGIAQRNTYVDGGDNGNGRIVNANVNDIAMTVLPNAPIDPDTGLPVPTIAVATDGGVSVIKDDGSVVDSAFTLGVALVTFDINHGIYYTRNTSTGILNYASLADYLSGDGFGDEVARTSFGTNSFDLGVYGYKDLLNTVDNIAITGNQGARLGIGLYKPDTSDFTKTSAVRITSDYNTGWMNGDIKLATLSDTDDTNVTGSELISNGTFDTDLTGWNDISSGTGAVSVEAGKAKLVRTNINNRGIIEQTVTTVNGATYVLTVERVSGAGLYVGIGTGVFSTSILGTGIGTGVNTFTFKATSTTTHINFRGTSDGTAYFDNVSVRLAEEDRSVNGNGLQVHGTVTKSAVATGAELVAYKVPTGGGYLKDDTFAPPTEDFCYMWWSKDHNSDRTQFYVGDLSANTPTPANGINVWSWSNSMKYRVCGRSFDIANQGTQDVTWSQHCVISRDRHVEIWINGELKARANVHRNDVIATGIHLMEGYYSAQHSGGMALFRVSATAPTAEQIAKIYRDEKPLFQENAKATLYGTSDAVTALAYDDDTELLHAGTSAGRSVFKGLQRVSNTTDAIGTAISASNDLVVEE